MIVPKEFVPQEIVPQEIVPQEIVPQEIVVVGGGCSGVLVAVSLLQSPRPLRVVLVERRDRVGPGLAYDTFCPTHLLNVPADKLSASEHDPIDFVRWARRRRPAVDAADFLPRSWYGDYLTDVLARAVREREPDAELEVISGRARHVSVDGGRAMVTLDDGERLEADDVVLALGHLGQRWPVGGLPVTGPRVIADPWAPGALDAVDGALPVVLVGTGLTMVDVACNLARRVDGPPMIAVSRHGLLPQPHPAERSWWRTPAPPALSSASELVRWVRELVARAEADGVGWQGAIDALRSHTSSVWTALPETEQARLLRHARRYWEVHRHRMPPISGALIDELQANGTLTVRRGRIRGGESASDGVTVDVRCPDGGEQRIDAGWVVNCTGPELDPRAAGDPLMDGLLADGLARRGPHGLGLDVDECGRVVGADGRPSDVLHTLGPLCLGARWETTAVPEIRAQAHALARRITVGERAQPYFSSAASTSP